MLGATPMKPRGTHVPDMMSRIETVLVRAGRTAEGVSGVHYVSPDHGDLDLAGLRHLANIRTDFFSGSARPVVGPGVRMAKRAVRRALRWYVEPMMAQQTRFNHAALDLVEKLRLQNARLVAEIESVRSSGPGVAGAEAPPANG